MGTCGLDPDIFPFVCVCTLSHWPMGDAVVILKV